MTSSDLHAAVAIVGMGCRWPGGVRDVDSLWDFLRQRNDGWRRFDGPRFSSRGFHHPDPARPGTMAQEGAFLADEDARLFDHQFFGISALEAETLDPSQRKLLEVAYEALENAGETLESIAGSRTGVFVGNFCLDHWIIQSRDWDSPRPYAFTGAGTSILANRISYIFNLRGPSLTVDTACSSSMYALHLAVNAIRAGDCDSALVASANWIADPSVQIALDKLGALSASSRCHTFDAKGDGYARGEGFAAIYIKKLPRAVSDGSPIRALIRGTATNSNGRTGGITRPSVGGQETVIREAYRNAGNLPLHDTDYIECHGTGTYVGDPIEIAAVGKVFAQERQASAPLLVGSIKSNMGHAEGASALASIMKVVLALERGAIPPLFKLETPNPNIPFAEANVEPVTELTAWPRNDFRRASINSFGYGGANAHCILDHVSLLVPDYVSLGVSRRPSIGQPYDQKPDMALNHISGMNRLTGVAAATTRQHVVIPFYAHNEISIELNVKALAASIERLRLADVAYTYATGRSRLSFRSFRIVDKDCASEGLAASRKGVRAPSETSPLGFVFTGQGAQWHAMGAELLEYRVFVDTVVKLDRILGGLSCPPPWTLYGIITGSCKPTLIQRPEVSQVACTALQIGLVDLLASWYVHAESVVGHSSGEMAAAYASGRITAGEAVIAAYFRGKAVASNSQGGEMLAVGLGAEQIDDYLAGKEHFAKVAAINSPRSVTLSGDVDAVRGIATALTEAGVFNRTLETAANAYHSHHMAALGQHFEDMLDEALAEARKNGLIDFVPQYPVIPWHSSVTPGNQLPSDGVTVAYWRNNLESPVRFSEAVVNLADSTSGSHLLVEIGPHPALKTPVEQILRSIGSPIQYTSTLKRQENGQQSMLALAGTLFVRNANIDLVAVNAVDSNSGHEHGVLTTGLPPYQYTYGPVLYHEGRASKEFRHRERVRHDLLGSKIPGNTKFQPQWRNNLRLKDLAWLGDHRLLPDAVFPATGYMALAVEAAQCIHSETSEDTAIEEFWLRDVTFKAGLRIPDDGYGIEIITSMTIPALVNADPFTWMSFVVSSVTRDTNEWTENCTGFVRFEVSKTKLQSRLNPLGIVSRKADRRSWYKRFYDIGLAYGSAFQPLSGIHVDPHQGLASAEVSLNTTASTRVGGESSYPIHPASLDGAIQLGIIASYGGRIDDADTAFVPVHLTHLYLRNGIKPTSGALVAHGEHRGMRSNYIDFQMSDDGGDIVLQASDLRCVSFSTKIKSTDQAFSAPYTRLVWRPHIRQMSSSQLRNMFPPPEQNNTQSRLWALTNQLAYLVVYSIYEEFCQPQDSLRPTADVGHFYEWIKRCGSLDQSQAMREARELTYEARLQKIEELASKASDVMEVKIAKLLHDNMADILYERRTGVDIILSEDLLTPLYSAGLLMTGIYPQLLNVLNLLGHCNPSMRVLEIGGGTGGATRIAMKAWIGKDGIKAYRDYTFTDISPGFLSNARETMADFPDFNYSVFDAEIDPSKQGFEEGAYDLIIACQVLHATSNMKNTLRNVRTLLKPGGQLVLVEATQNFIVPGVVVGTFTGYWASIPDGRVDAPFMTLPSWDRALRAAGFSGNDLVLDDFPRPHNTTSVLVSTALSRERERASTRMLVLYAAAVVPALAVQLSQELQRRGIATQILPFEDTTTVVPHGAHVITLLGDGHLLVEGVGQDFQAFQHLAHNARRMTVVTSCGIAKGRNPNGAVVAGLLRVLGLEHPASRFLSIDLDAENFNIATTEIEDLVRSIVDCSLESQSMLNADQQEDLEFVWQGGCLWSSRLTPDDTESNAMSQAPVIKTLALSTDMPVRAAFESVGITSSLYFTSYRELLRPLPRNFIDVNVAAIGLNESDLASWAGRSDTNYLSSEYAGIITAVGSEVTGLTVGDRVFGIARGQLSNRTRALARLACRARPQDDLVELASMPFAFMTAVYAVDHVLRPKKGCSVLIQSATSDIGLAILRLVKARGALPYAMVDAHEQAQFLIHERHIPSERVILAPTSSDFERYRARFDVVMTSATDINFLPCVQCLGPLGHLVHFGQLKKLYTETLATDLSEKHAHFSSIDSTVFLDSRLDLGSELMQAVGRYLGQVLIGPIQPITIVPAANLPTGSAPLSTRKFIGKLVVSFAGPQPPVRMEVPSALGFFDPEAVYIITGGLGGLGLSILRWMSERGARHIALLSRRESALVPQAQSVIELLAADGISIVPVSCDITSKDQLAGTISKLTMKRPLKGIVHAAVSYEDLSFERLDLAKWQTGLAAKVNGTSNLHETTLGHNLDFFVMPTTIVSILALATQGAYVAANNFQDYFARFRRQQGLPASTMSFSLVNDITDVGSNRLTIDAFERNKAFTLSENQFLALLEPAFFSASQMAPANHQVALHLDLLSGSNIVTCFDPAAMRERERDEGRGFAQLPRWHEDARVSLILRGLADAQIRKSLASAGTTSSNAEDENSATAPSRVKRGLDAALGQRADGKPAAVTFVASSIAAAVAEKMFVDEQDVDCTKSIADHGVDSLVAAELRNWLVRALDTDISMLVLLDQGTSILMMAEKIVSERLE